MHQLQIQPLDEADLTAVLDLIMELPVYLQRETLDTLLLTEVNDLVRKIIGQTRAQCQNEAEHVQQSTIWHRQIGRG